MNWFVDYASGNLNKVGEELCGDTVEFCRANDYTIAVLSDGLGSGVKANILATLTTKIAITMLKEGLPIEDVVNTITNTLPVCQVRNLAYSTFTIVKIDPNGIVYIVEFDSPNVILIRNGVDFPIEFKQRKVNGRLIKESEFQLLEDDTLVFVSDGVIHAGVGKVLNLGWGWKEVSKYLKTIVDYRITAKQVTSMLLQVVNDLYRGTPGDDVTVVTLKATKPKQAVLFSGPPINPDDDRKVMKELMKKEQIKIVCGGTAANIVARELNKEVTSSFEFFDPAVPPVATIEGIDLVTEGVLTIKEAVNKLKQTRNGHALGIIKGRDGASRLARLLLNECTHIKFLVGKAINPAHQNPDFPQDLSIKLHVIKELQKSLIDLGKVVEIQYY